MLSTCVCALTVPFCLYRSLNTAESALKSATDLRKDAMQLCLEDFMSGVRDQSALPAQLFTPGQSYGAEMQLERRSPQAAAGIGPSLCYVATCKTGDASAARCCPCYSDGAVLHPRAALHG